MKILTLDIETECAVPECPGGSKCFNDYKHALIPFKSCITVVGVKAEGAKSQVFRGLTLIDDLRKYLQQMFEQGYRLNNQEMRFDIKTLHFHGIDGYWLIDHWEDDTKLMAYVLTEKVSDEFMTRYSEQRQVLNKELPQGYSHRKAGKHSLKTLAPYFLGVEPFWENPTNHDSDDYVIKDVEYTHQLREELRARLISRGQWNFYKNYQMRWVKELLKAELRGVRIDNKQLAIDEEAAKGHMDRALRQLKEEWTAPFDKYHQGQIRALRQEYDEKCKSYYESLKNQGREAWLRTKKRYNHLHNEKIEKLAQDGELLPNPNSPKDLMWILRDYFKLDVKDYRGKESTDKEVLEPLAHQNEGVKLLLEYRKWNKLASTYYPSYHEFQHEGRVFTSLNTADTRTGRLSCSMPNLQNQPGITRSIFVSDPGTKFIIRDLSAIEPTMVAYFTQDPVLVDLLANGKDFHGATATAIFPHIKCDNRQIKAQYPAERQVAKTAGLAILYGSGARRLKNILEKEGFLGYSTKQCREIVKRIRALYEGVWNFKQELDHMLADGETAYNYFGRPIYFDNVDDIYMKGFNRLIQGSASDLLLESIVRVNEYARGRQIDAQVLLPVHDEILMQCQEDAIDEMEDALEDIMTSYDLDGIPLRVEGETAERWVK